MEKDIGETTLQNKKAILFWINISVVILIGISSCSLLDRTRSQTNTQPPAVEPTHTATADLPSTKSYSPVFEAAPCSFKVLSPARVTCGFVIVPENRNGDVTDTIQIAVAVYHSNNDMPEPDPILYLQGGPGALAIDWSAEVYESVIAPLLDERDFIVFDARGVGYSKPALDCEEIKSTYLSDVQGKLPPDKKASYYEGALLTCRNHFQRLGADLSTYTSSNLAADARDVIHALGYDQANLYGVSYGTRVAQFVMRGYPEVVRSAILDSVVPVENRLLQHDARAEYDRLIQLLFEDCKSQTLCSSTYPDLEEIYNETINELDARPVKVVLPIGNNKTLEQEIDGYWFRETVVWGLRNPQTIATIPRLIYRTRDQDYSFLTIAAALPLITFDSISMGTYVAVNCHDQVFAIPTEGLDETIYDLCRLWGVMPPEPGENDPVNSDIPALIITGKYDPVTPVDFAHQLATHLSNSYVVEISNQGHAPSVTGTSDCPTQIISSFLQNPNTSPDLACVVESKEINYSVPYTASSPIPLDRIRIDQFQLNTRIPAGWSDAEFGFYSRGASYGDITQVGVQRSVVSEADWANWLIANFGGNRGFDQPASRSGQRNANGLTWNLYRTTSQGNPVDIAFAKYGYETFMVLLISHKDEHDALYRTVFIPIIDSTTPSN